MPAVESFSEGKVGSSQQEKRIRESANASKRELRSGEAERLTLASKWCPGRGWVRANRKTNPWPFLSQQTA